MTSDRLARLCRRNRIPIPPQGYWNRGLVQLAVGSRQLAADGEQFAAASAETLRRARVGTEAWTAALSEIAGRKVEPLPEPDRDWRIEMLPSEGHVPGALPPAKTIEIPDKLKRPHRLIRETRSILKDSSQDEHSRTRPSGT